MEDIIEQSGLSFRVTVEPDEFMRAPWLEDDGHGNVEERRTDHTGYVPKRPGEVVLKRDRWSGYVYDREAALETARRDCWGLSDRERAKLMARLGRAPTAREVIAEAVDMDIEYLRGWLNGDWHWCYVSVELLDAAGDGTGMTEGLCGIASDDSECLAEVAADLAKQLADLIGDAATYTVKGRAHTTVHRLRA